MSRNSALDLILHLLKPHPSETHSLSIDPALNWPLFYKLVLRHRIWHYIQRTLIPPINNPSALTMSASLTQHCQHDQWRIFITAAETTRIARQLTEHSIKHCFIKGTVLNEYLYGALNTRPCRDIDVWVDISVYSFAADVLLSLGYQKQLPAYDLSEFKEKYYLSHKHDMAFYLPDRQVLVELHFRLSYFGIQFFPFSAVTLKPITLLNVPVITLDDDYHLLYLIIHGAIHAWIRLRWLHDIALFIHLNRCDLNRVVLLSKQMHCQHLVEQALILVHDLFSLKNPELNLLAQHPSRRGAQLAHIAKQFIAADYEMTDGLRKPKIFFYYRFYLAKVAVRGHKVQAVLGDLFKIDKIFSYVTFPKSLSFMYYLCYPLWLIRFTWQAIRQ